MQLIPESAPFTEDQRAWLNGFFSGLLGQQQSGQPKDALTGALQTIGQPAGQPKEPTEDAESFPWHDSTLPIAERMKLAEGKPLKLRMMAAMAQLNCGACGYLCKTYSEAIANGTEKNLTLCAPGGAETAKMLRTLSKENIDTTNKEKAETPTKPKTETPTKSKVSSEKQQANAVFSRTNPYSAVLLQSKRLNLKGSIKDTRHVVIDLGDSGIKYTVGDALGIFPSNSPELVGQILSLMSWDSSRKLVTQKCMAADKSSARKEITLRDHLIYDCCLKAPTDELLQVLREKTTSAFAREELARILDEGATPGFDVLDALKLARVTNLEPQTFLPTLSPSQPRLYSIASSQSLVGNQVHLVVGRVAYEIQNRYRKGVASTMLSDRLAVGDRLRIYVHSNHGGFTVPKDPAAPMIMVGPGTGIAPFRAFLQERQVQRAPGKNWLFFGDQHYHFDFLYKSELEQWTKTGLLTHLDVAFSRDQPERIYVQDRMLERAAELWGWLQEGAYFFVCGDAARMAQDVDSALRKVIASQGNLSDDAAKSYLNDLAKQKRYVRDVY